MSVANVHRRRCGFSESYQPPVNSSSRLPDERSVCQSSTTSAGTGTHISRLKVHRFRRWAHRLLRITIVGCVQDTTTRPLNGRRRRPSKRGQQTEFGISVVFTVGRIKRTLRCGPCIVERAKGTPISLTSCSTADPSEAAGIRFFAPERHGGFNLVPGRRQLGDQGYDHSSPASNGLTLWNDLRRKACRSARIENARQLRHTVFLSYDGSTSSQFQVQGRVIRPTRPWQLDRPTELEAPRETRSR
jgi:hypothetical protein